MLAMMIISFHQVDKLYKSEFKSIYFLIIFTIIIGSLSNVIASEVVNYLSLASLSLIAFFKDKGRNQIIYIICSLIYATYINILPFVVVLPLLTLLSSYFIQESRILIRMNKLKMVNIRFGFLILVLLELVTNLNNGFSGMISLALMAIFMKTAICHKGKNS
jgi:hypothetical protein